MLGATVAPIIRQAEPSDFEAICTIDNVAQRSTVRRDRIKSGIERSEISVVVKDGLVTGYALLSYSFFGHGFMELVFIDPRCQGSGLGPLLIRHLESRCTDRKLFTTTNQSNVRMQGVLDKLGYEESGVIYNLDPGDPELVYFKVVRGA